jgi:hypothetical protein
MSERTQEPDAAPRGADASAQPVLAAAEALAPATLAPGTLDPGSLAAQTLAAQTLAAEPPVPETPTPAAYVAAPPRPDLAAGAPPVLTTLDASSVDVATPAAETALPGVHRGGFTRPPTAPIDITEQQPEFVPTTGVVVIAPAAGGPANLGGIALGFSIIGLIASIVVGIALPIGLTGIVLGVLSLRRRFESRPVALWAISLGAVSVLYSAGWLLWAAYRAGWLA